jgi:F0F1-type ATP synthase membrane subunit b/b'
MGFEPQQVWSTLELVNEFAEHMALGIEEAKAALKKVKVALKKAKAALKKAKDEYAMFYNR